MSSDAMEDLKRLIDSIDEALAAHRTPDKHEIERLTRWRRELQLQLADLTHTDWQHP